LTAAGIQSKLMATHHLNMRPGWIPTRFLNKPVHVNATVL